MSLFSLPPPNDYSSRGKSPRASSREKDMVSTFSRDKLYWEKKFWKQGIDCVAGLDEAGRGAWAGPVVAAAVVLKPGTVIEGVDDSKCLTPAERERLFTIIQHEALSYAVSVISSQVIDSINILQASLLAMRDAVDALPVKPGHLIVDGNQGIATPIPQMTLIRGDSLSMSVGAASILAKVTRDRMMTELENVYPDFHFSGHKGYGTRAHAGEIKKNGVQACHRKSFNPMRTILALASGA